MFSDNKFTFFILLSMSVFLRGMNDHDSASSATLRQKINSSVPSSARHENPLTFSSVPPLTSSLDDKDEDGDVGTSTDLYNRLLCQSPDRFEGRKITTLKKVLATAPDEIQWLIGHLMNQKKGDEEDRARYLIGKPGAGKTTLVLAIVEHVAKKWGYRYMVGTDVKEGHRDQATSDLKKEFKRVEKAMIKRPTIFIIDELHRLLDHADSENYDTDTSSTAICSFLDRHISNNRFFFIGIMNRAHTMPETMKSRIGLDAIVIDTLPQKALFEIFLESCCLELQDDEITAEMLFEKFPLANGRMLTKLGTYLRRIGYRKDNDSAIVTITKEHLEQALCTYKNLDVHMKFGQEEESDVGQRERHHREQIALTAKGHQLQRVLARKQVRANIILQENTIASSTQKSAGSSVGNGVFGGNGNYSSSSSSTTISPEAKKTIEEIFDDSDESECGEAQHILPTQGENDSSIFSLDKCQEMLTAKKSIATIGMLSLGGMYVAKNGYCTIQ